MFRITGVFVGYEVQPGFLGWRPRIFFGVTYIYIGDIFSRVANACALVSVVRPYHRETFKKGIHV